MSLFTRLLAAVFRPGAKTAAEEEFNHLADKIKTSENLNDLYSWQELIPEFDRVHRRSCDTGKFIKELNFLTAQRRKHLQRSVRWRPRKHWQKRY